MGKGYKAYGSREFVASISANSVKTKYYGYNYLTFNNTKTKFIVHYPLALMSGTAIGRRVLEFTKKFYFFNLEHNLYCEVDFDDHSSIFNKKPKLPKNGFVGSIYRINDQFKEKLKEEMEKNKELDLSIKEKHIEEKLDDVHGNWLFEIVIGGKTYWEYGKDWGHAL
mmetsp:Transcript_17020/g.14907  ORF Transcript_17020/g.14907 Transcript_17020/m.14907 type:complete len:167 (-) Transcript_17020:279-779(-)